jgi:hypothetical protein
MCISRPIPTWKNESDNCNPYPSVDYRITRKVPSLELVIPPKPILSALAVPIPNFFSGLLKLPSFRHNMRMSQFQARYYVVYLSQNIAWASWKHHVILSYHSSVYLMLLIQYFGVVCSGYATSIAHGSLHPFGTAACSVVIRSAIISIKLIVMLQEVCRLKKLLDSQQCERPPTGNDDDLHASRIWRTLRRS